MRFRFVVVVLMILKRVFAVSYLDSRKDMPDYNNSQILKIGMNLRFDRYLINDIAQVNGIRTFVGNDSLRTERLLVSSLFLNANMLGENR